MACDLSTSRDCRMYRCPTADAVMSFRPESDTRFRGAGQARTPICHMRTCGEFLDPARLSKSLFVNLPSCVIDDLAMTLDSRIGTRGELCDSSDRVGSSRRMLALQIGV